MTTRGYRLWLLPFAALAGTACNDSTPAGDGDGGGCVDGEIQRIGGLRADDEYVGMLEGATRTVRVWAVAAPSCPITLSVAVEPAGIVTLADTSLEMAADQWYVDVELTAEAVGTATVSVTYDVREARFTADVVTPDIACSGTAGGTLGPGDRVEATSGGLSGAYVSMPADDSLPSFDATLACADDIVPDGWVKLGPAVAIGPTRRFLRELPAAIPVKAGLLPATATLGDVTIFFTDGRLEPRAVPLASTWLAGAPGGGILSFATPRLGTFQAAYEQGVGTRTRTRHFTYRGITGVSMGGGGAANIGLRHPELFDFVAPLGGPANWTYMLHYVWTYHLGGFCTASEDDGGEVGEHCPTLPPTQVFEIAQEFENWFYPDGRDGQGGTFNREDYSQIFRDMSLAFGNPGVYNEDSVYLPPGVPQSWWELSEAERCANPVVLDDFYDDEYNPDGHYQVITFCEGAEVPGDVGRWDPDGTDDFPLDIGLAVDVDGDTVRDAGEPVVRSGYEPFDDTGIDGVADADEDGYDPVANPDPNGDDFDYQFNPEGTEQNWLWDGPSGTYPGEPWADVGLDGVPGTPQQDADGYDWGEDNAAFDYSPNFLNFLAHDGYNLIASMPSEQLDRIDVLGDAGIRDLFVFAPGMDTMMAALSMRGYPVRYYDDFGATYGVSGVDEVLDPKDIDFPALGRHTMIRYGDPEASEERVIRGDGGHVGTVAQVLNRLAYATFSMSGRWPDGDRRPSGTDTADTMRSFDFTSSDGRVSPVSMILPPGYFREEFAETRYPVVYFLHGYGQQPQDLVTSAIVFQNWMVARDLPVDLRMQKLIMVFPDGRCRSPEGTPDHLKECLKGTFYADSVRPDGPQMESILMELIDYMDDNYRTKQPEDVEVVY